MNSGRNMLIIEILALKLIPCITTPVNGLDERNCQLVFIILELCRIKLRNDMFLVCALSVISRYLNANNRIASMVALVMNGKRMKKESARKAPMRKPAYLPEPPIAK